MSLPPEEQRFLRTRVTQFQSIFIGLMGCLGIFGTMAYAASIRAVTIYPMAQVDVLAKVFMAIYIAGILFMRVLRNKLMEVPALGPHPQALAWVGTRYQQTAVTTAMFIEAGGLYGLGLTFGGADFSVFLMFAAITAVLFLLYFPRQDEIEQMLEAARRVPNRTE